MAELHRPVAAGEKRPGIAYEHGVSCETLYRYLRSTDVPEQK